MPFAYRELTYPARVGPFPATLVLTPTSPQTMFQFTMRSRRERRDNIEVQVSPLRAILEAVLNGGVLLSSTFPTPRSAALRSLFPSL